MAGVTRNMIVRVGGDFSGLIRGSQQGARAAEQFARTTQTSFRSIGNISFGGSRSTASGIQSIFKSVTSFARVAAVVATVVPLIKKSVDAASDLAEAQNVVNVSFGELASKAEDFAKKEAKMFGLSELQAKQFSGRYMSMATSLGVGAEAAADMSIELTKLSGDVASFYNIKQDEAYSKLRGVFTGETEALKDLGVVMTQTNLQNYALAQGIRVPLKEMKQSEQTLLRYSFVMDALKNAQGDFAATSDSWANRIRTLQNRFTQLLAIIGKGLIAIANPFVNGLNAMLGAVIAFANDVSDAFSSTFGTDKTEIKANVSINTDGMTDSIEEALSSISGGADTAADKVGSVGDEAKKAAKALGLMKFDDINKLPSEISSKTDKATGSSGGSATGGSVPSSVANSITSTVEQATGSAFDNVGAVIGDKLKIALDSIEWEPIKAKAKDVGSKLASTLNGFVKTSGLDDSIGKTVGNLIVVGLTGLDAFVTASDWKAVGSFVAGGVNGAVKTLKESDVNFGSVFANLINAGIDGLDGFADRVHWKDIGTFVTDNANSFFDGVGWKKAGETANNLTDGLRDMLTAGINNIDAASVAASVVDFITGLNPVDIAVSVAKVTFVAASKGVEIVADIFSDIASNVEINFWDIVTFAKDPGQAVANIAAREITEAITKDEEVQKSIEDTFKAVAKMIVNFTIGEFEQGLNDTIKNINNAFGTNIPTINITAKINKAIDGLGAEDKTIGATAKYIAASDALKAGHKKIDTTANVTNFNDALNPNKKKLDTTAVYTSFEDALKSSYKKVKTEAVYTTASKGKGFNSTIGGMKAEFTRRGKGGKFDSKIGGMTAQFDSKTQSKKFNYTISGMIAAITDKKNSIPTNKRTLSPFKASVSDKSQNIPQNKLTLDGFTAYIKDVAASDKKTAGFLGLPFAQKADGGIFYGGQWHDFGGAYASGGMPNSGQMFIAREAGPELVGTIGGHTAVVNNGQIVASIETAVERAMSRALSGISAGGGDTTVQVVLDGKVIATSTVNELNRRTRMTGSSGLLV